jgi:hypothetical protein
MNTRSGWMRGALAVAMVVGPFAGAEAEARGGRGGHGGHASHPPRVAAVHRSARPPSFKPPKMPHASAPAHRNTKAGAQVHNSQVHNSQVHHANTAVNHANAATSGTHRGTTAAGARPAVATSTVNNTQSAATNPFGYTYGSGSRAQRYHAYGYGRGYRNRNYGGRRGYGRSQGQNRAVVGRLRSVHASLARIDHDYQGHRVRAMQQVSMAIRQLSHRSMGYGGMGYGSGMNGGMGMNGGRGMGMNGGRGMGLNNGMGMAGRQGGLGAGGRGMQRMSQAQSDARMGQSLRNLQGVNMQLTNLGSNTSGHSRARGHVTMAMHELNTALMIR